MRVEIKPGMLRWARERAGLSVNTLTERFPKFEAWEQGTVHPTLNQMELFASITHVPIGYLFLPEPPIEVVPIPDFRTTSNARLDRPSPDLLEMVYICQQRQEWYHDYARASGEAPLPFVGSVRETSNIEETAATMRSALRFDLDERRRMPTWTDALRSFIEQADAIGVLIMCSGVVLNNTHRPLDPEEFRGFAMADNLAPMIFINGKDTTVCPDVHSCA